MTTCQYCGNSIPEDNTVMRELRCCGKATCSTQRCYFIDKPPKPTDPVICAVCALPIHTVFGIRTHYDCGR